MSFFSLRTVFTIAASAVLVTTGFAGAANANAADAPYCTGTVVDSGSDATVQTHCFATFGESITYATGGKVTLSNAAQSRAVSADELKPATAGNVTASAASPAAVVVISIDYQNANFSGASYTWTAGSACGSFAAASMPLGWNDTVSSVATYNGCGVTLYQNGSYGGTHFNVGVNSSAANLGSFNDQASSEKWCTAPTC